VVMLFQSERLRLESIDQIATVWLDRHVMDSALAADLSQALRIVCQSSCIDVLVLRGGKADHFLIGPDLDECARLQDEISLRDFSMHGQYLLQRLEQISEIIPTVAYIDGRCTNAGMELALACDYRLAVARPETLIGFDPLVRGWLPCWGATQRLPRLLGLRAASSLLTNSQFLPARAARKLGLIDHVFGPRPAKAELNWFLAELQDHPRRPRRFRGQSGWFRRLWEQSPRGRTSLFDSVRASLFHDPLALALLDALKRGARFGLAEGFRAERNALVQTVLSGTHRERFEPARTWEEQTMRLQAIAVPSQIGVVGLSSIGIDLAACALRFGGKVTVYDADEPRLQRGLAKLQQGLETNIASGWWTIADRDQKRQLLRGSATGEGIESADLIFLAGSPKEQRRFVAESECLLPEQCIVASTEPAANPAAHHPERCLAWRVIDSRHVDFITGTATSETACNKLARWFDHCGYQIRGLPARKRREEKVAAFAA